MESAIILSRFGDSIPASRIEKATTLVTQVTDTNLPTVWHVHSSQKYRVIIDAGTVLCDCPARVSLCAHVLAVWMRQWEAGSPVRVTAIDGAELTAVDGPDDPFEGLGA